MSTNSNPAKVIAVKKGNDYYWCACGLSAKKPFCDGSHKDVPSESNQANSPVKFTAEKDQYVYFCGCMETKEPPFCDGSHIPR
ncbi:MAG: CDGSH iron-sulfur domain-containing protein [Pseudomonadales bacterium]|nr:CDGSH iron-sulfur domain-containing protein [Pseudomonadales bacterium]